MRKPTALLPDFDREMATTRALLERVPEDRPDWRPHPKSTPLGLLALHIARLPWLAAQALRTPELDISPPGEPPRPMPTFTSTAAVLEAFDANVREARDALVAATEEELLTPWSLKKGGQVLYTLPRADVLRLFVLNHLIHHRGQLSVYLRLNDVPLPPIYGPTADTED